MSKKFQVIGHRGACAYAPENTLSSFELAAKMGVDSIETDIRTTKDGILVLFHDNLLDRKSNGSGRVDDHTYGQLKRMDFGSWFSLEFIGENIVSLEELLQVYGNKIHLNLEIKSENIEDKLVQTLKSFGLDYSKFIITSFELDYLVKVRNLEARIQTAYLTGCSDVSVIDICDVNGIAYVCPCGPDVTPGFVELAHSRGLMVRTWGVGSLELMEHVVECGADGTTVDFPDKLSEYLKRNEETE